jgi:hypothetical protein
VACSRVNFNISLRSTVFPLNCVGGSVGTVTTGFRFQTLRNFVHLVQNGCSAHPPSYPVDTGFLFFDGVQRPTRDADKSYQCMPKLRIRGSYLYCPPYIFVTWCLIRLYLLSAQYTSDYCEACLVNRATCEGTRIHSSLGAQDIPLTTFPPDLSSVPLILHSQRYPAVFPRACSGPAPGSSLACFLMLRLRLPEDLLINT